VSARLGIDAGIIRFWTTLIEACNGELVTQDGWARRLPDFPT
jgi:hypothetical protein